MKCFILKPKVLTFTFISLFSLSSYANNAGSLSYRDLPELVKNNDGSVQSARLMVKASEKRTGHLLRSFYPTLKAVAGYENYTTINIDNRSDPYGRIEASLNIFRFGQDKLEDKMRNSELQRSKAELALNYNSKLFEARQIYWRIVYHSELIKVLKAARSKNKNLLRSANHRIKRGIITKTDRLDFEIYQTDLDSNVESFEHENKILKIALSKYIGANDTSINIGKAFIPHEHNEKLLNEQFNSEKSPTAKLALASSDLFQFKSKKAKRWWTPSVELYGGYGLYTVRQRDYLNRADRDDTWLGIRLKMNIFDGNKSSSESAFFAARAAAEKEKSKYANKEESVRFKMFQEEMKHAHELTHYSEDKVKKGEIYLQRTLKEYDKGVKNSLDALSSLKRIVSFKAEYAKIRLEYQLKKATLERIKGI